MKISEICVRRPVFATVLSLVVVLVGLVSYDRLSVREYPKIDPPVVNVETAYPGASPEIIETQVTQVLEEQLAGIEGVDFMSSVSRQEQSQITVTFELTRDPADAAADVRDRVSRARENLPDEVDEPVIQKVEADAQPIIYLAFSSERHAPMDITDYADRYVKDQLQTLSGVAQVRIFGERMYSMRIWLDPDRLAAYDLTPQDVETALRQQNVEVPAGLIESRGRQFTILSETDLRTPEQFDAMVLRDNAGYLIRLSDVGYAELGPRNEDRVVRFNGEPAIALGVVKQATANPLDVSDAVRARLPAIRESLPEGMRVEVAHDSSVFIQESIDNVYTTIAEAVLLVVAIIFLFLRSLRATLIPLVTIPVSLIGAFALMDLFGFSINTLTLLAMVLAIGLVVDDAIVMLENIYRHVENGVPPREAAITGAREIGFAVIAMTVTLAAVYAPIGFMTGKTGQLFTEFAWALAGAVLVSGFVALTATPMMCALMLKPQAQHGLLYRIIERGLNALTGLYRRSLRGALRARPLVLLLGAGVAASAYFFFTQINSELAPYEDQGTILGVYQAPQGATIDYTDSWAYALEEIYANNPNVDRYFVVSGFPIVSQGISFVKLPDWSERDLTQQQVAGELMPEMTAVPGIMAFPVSPPPLGQSTRDKPVQLVIMTSQPYAELNAMADRIMAEAGRNPGLVNLESSLKLNTPQLRVDVDRDKIADLGLSVGVLGRTLESMMGGRQVTRFERAGQQYDVVVQLDEVDRATPDDLRRVYVRGGGGEMVQLSNIISISETVAPQQLDHFNQLRSAQITANLADGYTLEQALASLEAAAQANLPATAQIDYAGPSREYKQSSASIYMTFVLALAFIYLVLAAQFESFRTPFIIMLTVPLSITGGLLALWLDGSTLNIYSQVGLVTLIGLITKHGILIVEFANQMREDGRPVREAVSEAAVLRLRPILMTTGAMVLGAVPLAIASGAGAQSRQDIGLVIVGGLLVGTFFTLFVIPVVYSYLMPDGRQEPSERPAQLTQAARPEAAE
ncbi:multidrug transporter AcrB [Rhodovibrio sodomensis]|uniref:Multidrug transporter AcrB n=1 Tax=Rhodovibrio sodomensis TaxID=1088 RepID=A0ABS1D9M5_9PROT|nr:multidrug transporter AcrB [Rhodovibrio sodomensis]